MSHTSRLYQDSIRRLRLPPRFVNSKRKGPLDAAPSTQTQKSQLALARQPALAPCCLAFEVGVDVVDGQLHGGDFLGLLVGNFGLEFLF